MNRRSFLAALGVATTTRKLGQWNRSPLTATEDDLITTLRYPYVQNVQGDRATIMWTTLEPGFGAVQFSPDGVNFQYAAARTRAFTRLDTGTGSFYQHQAVLTGLTPGASYFYQVTVNGLPVSAGGEWRFRTAAPGPFKFLVFGDSGYGSDEQFAIAQRLLAENASLILHVGDIVYVAGTPYGAAPYELYQRRYFDYYAATMSSVPFFPCPGNHDYEALSGASYMAIHSVPAENVPSADRGRYYSFDWSNVHFVSIDGHLSLERAVNAGGPMLRWLENDLRTTRQFWKVVYLHYPPWGVGPNENDIHTSYARQLMTPILETHGVQIVFSGHEHSYQRSQPIRQGAFVSPDIGITYFVCGGGGAFLYDFPKKPVVAAGEKMFHYLRVEVRGGTMTFRVIGADGRQFEQYTLSPKPVLIDPPNNRAISFQSAPTQGSFIRINGRNLAEEALVCGSTPPTELGGATVSVNGQSIPILYASPTQIYAQLPFTVDGNITVRVTTANGFSETSANPG